MSRPLHILLERPPRSVDWRYSDLADATHDDAIRHCEENGDDHQDHDPAEPRPDHVQRQDDRYRKHVEQDERPDDTDSRSDAERLGRPEHLEKVFLDLLLAHLDLAVNETIQTVDDPPKQLANRLLL